MTEEQVKDILLYMDTIGFISSEDWSSDSQYFDIGESSLFIGIWWALDDKTGKHFNTLGEIVGFYGLPVLPDNVRTKEELEEFKRVVGFKP